MIYKTLNKVLIGLLLSVVILSAQPDTFVRVSANPTAVKVKQPVNMRISVYTTTWFTRAPDLSSIVIPGALTIRKDRAQSIYETINNVRYTILYFEFFVFPARSGDLTIPAIMMKYATPATGDFQGIEVERKTRSIVINVEALDEDYILSTWLVASGFWINESWSKDLTKLKAGDVVKRTITTRATGTLAALIPVSDSLIINWGRQYKSTPVMNNEITEGTLRAERIEKLSVLIEKPGEFILPEQIFTWWNPNNSRILTRKIPARKVIIEDNPDLTILRSIQDSLDTINQSTQQILEEDKPFTILGLLIWQFIIIIILMAFILYQLYKLVLFLRRKLRERKELYLQSEKYYFARLNQTCAKSDLKTIKNHLQVWINKRCESERIIPAGEFISRYGDEELKQLYSILERGLFGKGSIQINFNGLEFISRLKSARKRSKRIQSPELQTLNP